MSEWDGSDRRSSRNDFNVKSEIFKAINETKDDSMKTVLLLMIGIVETQERGLNRIEKKIDAVLRDEVKIKAMVLNGHNESHHVHHDWIAEQMQRDKELKPVCEWAKQKMVEDIEHTKSKQGVSQKFMEGISGNAGALLAAAAIGWLLAHFGWLK